jgi:pyruvate dehydrogenase E1 component alpha subunit
MATTTKASKRLSDDLTDDTLVGWLRSMSLIREFEVRTMQAYANAMIGGFCHVYTGQEACAVGTLACVEHDDPMITAYRDHGHALARGMDPRACMAEMFGRITGCAKGKGGSMHMFDKPNHNYGGHGIVGAQTPVGAGLAFAAKYEREVLKTTDKKRVALCYLGDGALNQGALHEAMNLAGVLGLPVIYIVENNGYSMGTSIERGTTMADDLPKKAVAYGMEGKSINGMDILDLYDGFKPLVDAVRDEVRPAFVEIKTYRYHGHSMSDPQKYRTKEEVSEFQEKDSIDRLAKHLIEERKALTEDDYKSMQKELRSIVRDAVKFAEESAKPDPATELYSDVYANPQPGLSPLREYTQGAPNPLLNGDGA